MFSWPALLLAPLVVLGQQSITYALVTPSCDLQSRTALHVVAAVSLVIVLAMTAMAWRAWLGPARSAPHDERKVTFADGVGASARPRFVQLVAVIVGALSALVCVALWVPIWMLSPCL